jgi:hypothetical protein
MKLSYNPKIVTTFFLEEGIPAPVFEFKFHPERKWRFDLAWTDSEYHHTTHFEPGYVPRPVAIEVQGGIWSGGRHNRGAAMLKEWEKLNEAAAMGWRIMYCQPSDLCTVQFATLIKRALWII